MRNYSFVFSDPDIFWLSEHVLDHIKFQCENSVAEVFFAQDLMDRFCYLNTGFFYVTPTPFVKSLFQEILMRQRLPEQKDTYEQYILRDIVNATKLNDSRLDTLDLLLYANGDVHFGAIMNKKQNKNQASCGSRKLRVQREGLSRKT